MDRLAKKQFISSVNEQFKSAKAVFVTHYHGLTVEKITKLRREIREVDADFKVVKNSLAKLAVKGTDFEHLTDFLSGPVALSFSKDPVSLAKAIMKFADENDHLKIMGGVADSNIVDQAQIKILSVLPSLDELRGKIIGLINSPASKLVGVLSAPGSQIARVLSAKANK